MTLWRTRKTFGTEMGLSCAFRQWRAKSHCSKLHGYALGFIITLEANSLNEQNWVYDFGNFEWLKIYLKDNFDHKTVIAKDDPLLEQFQKMERFQALDLVVLNDVGCEKFAEVVFNFAVKHLKITDPEVKVLSVECFEHSSNSSSYVNIKGGETFSDLS